MAQMPREITWMVGTDHGHVRTLCLEAHSERAATAFLRRCNGTARIVRTPIGLEPDGKPMDELRRRNLLQGIRRNLQRKQPATDFQPNIRDMIVTRVAEHHGFTAEEVMSSARHPAILKARGHIAHELRSQLDLPLTHIAEILGLKGHSTIAYWLDKPYVDVSTPDKERPWTPTTQGAAPHCE